MKNINGLFIIITLMIISCSNDDDNGSDQQFVLDNGFKIKVLNAQDEDLLNPETQGALDYNEMKLFYLIDGEKKEVFENTADQPRNLFLFNETMPYQLGVGTYDGIDNFSSKDNDIFSGEHTAYLQLSDTDTDTIKTSWESKKDLYFRIKKIWYNGKEYDKDQEIIIRK